jgi:hypothetical protein
VPPLYSILSDDDAFSVVVPNFTDASRRKAARVLWEAHVRGGTPLAHVREFTQLIKAGVEKTFYRYSQADPETWGERWGEHGDLREESLLVFWYLDDDIPGRSAWGED